MCAHSSNAWRRLSKVIRITLKCQSCASYLNLKPASNIILHFLCTDSKTGFTKSFSFKDNLYLLVLQQNSSYLSFRKLLGTHGPQVGNFPSLAQCLYCSARNAVVVLTLQWLGRTLLWSTTWSQTASDMPSRVSPTASLRDRRQSEKHNKMFENVLRAGSVESRSKAAQWGSTECATLRPQSHNRANYVFFLCAVSGVRYAQTLQEIRCSWCSMSYL